MSNILLTNLLSRKEYLNDVLLKKEVALQSTPEGKLRTSTVKGHYRYYHVLDEQNNRGMYLKQKDYSLARALAQKDYDQKIIRAAGEELKILERLIRQQERSVEEVYPSLNPARRELVAPISLTDDEYIAHWLESKKCEPMGFSDDDPVILTTEGYRVRSKSEQLWADLMEEAGVPHVFEPQIYLEGHGWIRPDFAGLNVRKRKEIVIEHFGMMDDPAYAEKNVDKLHDYERNGFVLGDDLLITMETKKFAPERKSIEELIKRHFL